MSIAGRLLENFEDSNPEYLDDNYYGDESEYEDFGHYIEEAQMDEGVRAHLKKHWKKYAAGAGAAALGGAAYAAHQGHLGATAQRHTRAATDAVAGHASTVRRAVSSGIAQGRKAHKKSGLLAGVKTAGRQFGRTIRAGRPTIPGHR